MTVGQKKRLISALKSLKEEYTGNIGGETDITNADNLVSEDESSQKIVSKVFDTKGDFDSYVNQHRGIQMTPKEIQAIRSYTDTKPTQQDNFFVKYETSDSFGNNTTTVIKKLKESNQFCWTAFSKNEKANPEQSNDVPDLKEANPEQPSQDITIDDTIRISKTNTFINDTDGSKMLGDFLRELDI